jgi:hypothetical protein
MAIISIVCVGSGIVAIPLLIFAPIGSFVAKTANSNINYGLFIVSNLLGIIFSAGFVLILGLLGLLINLCANYIMKFMPTIHKPLLEESVIQNDPPRNTTNQTDNVVSDSVVWYIIIYFVSMWFHSAAISYLIYETTDLNMFLSVLVGNTIDIVGGLCLNVIFVKFLHDKIIAMCVYLGTHYECCRNCLRQCADPIETQTGTQTEVSNIV